MVRWFNIGNLLASVVLKVRADANPMDWRTSIYTQFGLLGLTMLIIPFLPESPCRSACNVRGGRNTDK